MKHPIATYLLGNLLLRAVKQDYTVQTHTLGGNRASLYINVDIDTLAHYLEDYLPDANIEISKKSTEFTLYGVCITLTKDVNGTTVEFKMPKCMVIDDVKDNLLHMVNNFLNTFCHHNFDDLYIITQNFDSVVIGMTSDHLETIGQLVTSLSKDKVGKNGEHDFGLFQAKLDFKVGTITVMM